jgi:DNA-binding transcriptional MerR regulator
MHLTISAFAKKFGLSRSTLLYYDRIGLLKPAGMSPSGYRIYGEREQLRMESIDTYRKAGLSLSEIRGILDSENDDALDVALENRLKHLTLEIHELKVQQQLIARLIKRDHDIPRYRNMNVEQWVAMLEEAGVDEAGLITWHKAFERDAPEEHQEFLVYLGLDEKEIMKIRAQSR